ncbi:DUF2267 domain-containing protein [Ferrovibrio xuzhouensis]|uniref:DUF2267 domain-containing protein n=1 Tax=Ferrovibrio xuzhouensis TaxID=1576914 RepID=A0ABV7VAM0_9PROT
MTMTGLAGIDTTVHETNIWLKGLMDRLQVGDRRLAYAALRSSLHALRDRMTPEACAHLSAQLPLLVRGLFYEGWQPGHQHPKEHHKAQFLDHIARELGPDAPFSAEEAAVAVFDLLREHIDSGEIRKLVGLMPREMRDLWQAVVSED